MTNPGSLPTGPSGPDPSGLGRAGSIQPDAALPRSERADEGGPAFKALLEKLEGKAREVRAAEQVRAPDELAGAADRAKASITDALSLKDQLLEAYRAAQHGKPGDEAR